MNRRDILKGLGALPFAAALNGSAQDHQANPSGYKIQSVQVLLEGAFTLVLEDKPRRITAFIPQDKTGRLGHDVYFNDPAKPLPKGNYKFALSPEGLRRYEHPYINPDFRDIQATTDVWNRGPELITLELPFPDSINFSGRPLRVLFKDGDGKKHKEREGKMPTSYILEYYTKPSAQPRLSCPEIGRECSSAPHCPPGTIRYFFGATPDLSHMEHEPGKHDEGKKEPCGKEIRHAIEFFNEVILAQFPKLRSTLTLARILDKGPHCPEDDERRGAAGFEEAPPARLLSAVFDPAANVPRLLRVADLLDCQVLGPMVNLKG
jgi:hypothetical protein